VPEVRIRAKKRHRAIYPSLTILRDQEGCIVSQQDVSHGSEPGKPYSRARLRDCAHGQADQHWLAAEREVLAASTAALAREPAPKKKGRSPARAKDAKTLASHVIPEMLAPVRRQSVRWASATACGCKRRRAEGAPAARRLLRARWHAQLRCSAETASPPIIRAGKLIESTRARERGLLFLPYLDVLPPDGGGRFAQSEGPLGQLQIVCCKRHQVFGHARLSTLLGEPYAPFG